MVNIKPIVLQALRGDESIVELLSGPKVYQQEPPEKAAPPLITFVEVENEPHIYADEKEVVSRIVMGVTPWVEKNKSTSAISREIDRVMHALGGKRERASDDEETVCESKPMAYSFIVDTETGEIL
ncbi:tail completion protein gp17 [Anaerospora hongkongensis]|uniref:tail completion protein gp17 n=1 Tax=Anaerospora hongkongensis TaxID=244830 RepID=UPI002FD9B180